MMDVDVTKIDTTIDTEIGTRERTGATYNGTKTASMTTDTSVGATTTNATLAIEDNRINQWWTSSDATFRPASAQNFERSLGCVSPPTCAHGDATSITCTFDNVVIQFSAMRQCGFIERAGGGIRFIVRRKLTTWIVQRALGSRIPPSVADHPIRPAL